MKKFTYIAVALIVVPQFALAAWWNPWSWNWGFFQRSEKANQVLEENAEKKAEKKDAATVKTNSNYAFPPAVKAATSALTGIAPLTVDFKIPTVKGYNYDGVYYTIAFGDGAAAGFPKCSSSCPSTLTASHTYASPGTYTAVIMVSTGCGTWECLGSDKEVATFSIKVSAAGVSTSAVIQVSGIYNYSNGVLTFLVPRYHPGTKEVSHFITLTFENQAEAIKMLKIDPSQTCEVGQTSIAGTSMSSIDISGYDEAKAEKDWKEKVVLDNVVSVSAWNLLCATP